MAVAAPAPALPTSRVDRLGPKDTNNQEMRAGMEARRRVVRRPRREDRGEDSGVARTLTRGGRDTTQDRSEGVSGIEGSDEIEGTACTE